MSSSLWPHGLEPTRLLCPWGFSKQKYWSGLPCLPPVDLPNPGIKPSSRALLDSLLSKPPGKSKNRWVVYPFSSGCSQPRNRIGVSCFADRFFTSRATREALYMCICSVVKSCPTLCDSMDCNTPGFPVHHQLPELAQTHVHWVSDTIQPSHLLSFPSPPAFNLSQHQVLFWVSSSHQVAKVLEFQLQHQSF